ncbi:MAG: hypothetical protein WCT77_03800 [Bacteroidota bacterium]
MLIPKYSIEKELLQKILNSKKDIVIPACPESFFSSSFENKEDSGQAGMTVPLMNNLG